MAHGVSKRVSYLDDRFSMRSLGAEKRRGTFGVWRLAFEDALRKLCRFDWWPASSDGHNIKEFPYPRNASYQPDLFTVTD
jgi:hypothetical protein